MEEQVMDDLRVVISLCYVTKGDDAVRRHAYYRTFIN
jgi:hypothetical protein